MLAAFSVIFTLSTSVFAGCTSYSTVNIIEARPNGFVQMQLNNSTTWWQLSAANDANAYILSVLLSALTTQREVLVCYGTGSTYITSARIR